MGKKTYLYGPVLSRRLGFSLGLDLFPKKSCSFDCLYCQLGSGPKSLSRRSFEFDLAKFKAELKILVKSGKKIDFITISGSGEPTLEKELGNIISEIKRVTAGKYPVCVITNSSLLYQKNVRKGLMLADLIIPSLDAATSRTFRIINRPCKGISLKQVISGIMKLRKEFSGEIWLEIMLVKGVNDSLAEAKSFKKIIARLKPDKVQLNIPIRPGTEKTEIPDKSRIEKIKKIISQSAEVVVDFKRRQRLGKTDQGLNTALLKFLKVRPATLADLSKALGVDSKLIFAKLKILINNKKIKKSKINKKQYFLSS